jgi:3-methylcrotonyl-CoA carboxylase alpha subunit
MAPPFKTILIANRGEIACRIMRTARRLGVRTVAVHSDADAGALHVAMADEAVRVGPPPAAESYLRGDRIVEAALATGAQAIHPGYGFLSENPDFVDQVVAAGLTFIGPSADAIRAMGLKDAAKALMEKAGVPVVPGYHGDAQALVLLAGKAQDIGYPVMIKARAGGGGRGMRRVERPEDFGEALLSARREAKAAFGDDAVLVEKYVERPRHIEVQVFGDNFGNAVHLFERDCSAQRRHQKVIEEAPAPGMTDEMRQAMTEAAVKAAKAIGYSGAGTVEFIVDGSDGLRPDRFWFMEMNTRLQVEHPVTEMVTGIDLVEWQLRVAAGEPLPLDQSGITLSGHAIEARLYAEDAARGFLPATGTLHHLAFPETSLPGSTVRIETGVRNGDTIPPFYDPMIAKVIAHGPDRETARMALGEALAQTRIAGTVTNLAFLRNLAMDEDFAAGVLDTGLIGRRQNDLVRVALPDDDTLAWAALIASGLLPPRSTDPWDSLQGYAHFSPMGFRQSIRHGEIEVPALIRAVEGGASVSLAGEAPIVLRWRDRPAACTWSGHVVIFAEGETHDFVVDDPLEQAHVPGGTQGSMRAPMPGLVKLVRAARGASVQKGDPLLVLEAMKMEHQIVAAQDGTVEEIAAEGSQVSEGTVLARFATKPA